MGSGFSCLATTGPDLDPREDLLAAANGIVEYSAIGAGDCQHKEFVGAHSSFPAIFSRPHRPSHRPKSRDNSYEQPASRVMPPLDLFRFDKTHVKNTA